MVEDWGASGRVRFFAAGARRARAPRHGHRAQVSKRLKVGRFVRRRVRYVRQGEARMLRWRTRGGLLSSNEERRRLRLRRSSVVPPQGWTVRRFVRRVRRQPVQIHFVVPRRVRSAASVAIRGVRWLLRTRRRLRRQRLARRFGTDFGGVQIPSSRRLQGCAHDLRHSQHFAPRRGTVDDVPEPRRAERVVRRARVPVPRAHARARTR